VKDYYAILGVNKQATDSEIKKAYRKLAGQHHPDRGGDTEQFKQVQEAYDILSDTSKRAEYDNPQGFYSRRNNFDDIMDQYFTQFNMRSQMRSSRIELWITLEDVAKGGPRLITVNTSAGSMPAEINIPQGIQDGEAIRYPKLIKGTDLVVGFRVNPHPEWHREGLDLWCEKPLNFWQLIIGTEVIVKDLLGRSVNLKVPPLTKPGSSLRLKGRGLQRSGHNTGDIFVRIQATMPEDIPEEILDILHKQDINK
jgi:DnaJ-class molecular chaperone